jgi:uncharacterized membrane protein
VNESAAAPKSAGPAPSREWFGVFVRALFVFGGVAPFLPAWSEDVPGLASIGRALDAWFSFQCHREAERSFAASAVCTRCLGIYVGLALGALLVRPRLGPKAHLAWMLGAALALILDVSSEALGWRAPSATLRFVTGFALAYPAAVSIARLFERRPTLENQSP